MKNKLLLATLLFAVLFAVPQAAHAVGGCNDSPEAPTEILMVLGAAGMFYGSSLVARLASKRRARS